MSIKFSTLEGDWDAVVEAYRSYNYAGRTNIGGGRGTALHVAVNNGHEYVVRELIDATKNDEEVVLKLKNERGDTPLHVAATRGFEGICKLIIGENEERKDLIKVRNKSGETPLFLAALTWQKQAFAYLLKVIQNHHHLIDLQFLIRDLDGDTILHSAIRREFFDLAVIIIKNFPMLHDIQNCEGVTPLKLLANRPSAFRSGTKLTWWTQIIYHCTSVQDLDAGRTLDRYLNKKNEHHEFYKLPENYRTCYRFFSNSLQFVRNMACNTELKKKVNQRCSATDEHIIVMPSLPQWENEELHQNVPPNYATCYQFVKFAFMYVLHLSGAASTVIRKIKKKHVWAGQLLSALMEYPTESYLGSGGSVSTAEGYKFKYSYEDEDEEEITPYSISYDTQREEAKKKMRFGVDIKQEPQEASNKKTDRDPEEKTDIKETAFLIAARNGIVEILKVILDKIPSALHDTTTDKKNVFHVAVKNRQPFVVEILLKNLTKQNTKNLIQAVDKDENTVLHLAAEKLSRETGPGGPAMQMMWEIKWFEKYVERHLPKHFILMMNKNDKTSGEIFNQSHKVLVRESSDWLKEISAVVTALVAGVAFATVSTIPGGTEGGKPALEGQPVFDAFAISSLIALVSSVTALIIFLSLLTSQKQAQDFRRNLPVLLLLGLTSLFLSIVAMFVSFCTGHFFVLNHKYRQFAFPIYVAACLPVTFYAIAQFPLYLALLNLILLKVPKPIDI